jgi:nicotinamidase-related amidase
MSNKSMELVIIDPQADFCIPDGEIPGVKTGALLVPGAYDDMKRLAKWIRKNIGKIDRIRVTLDSHTPLDVAHKGFWVDQNGNHPLPLSEAIKQTGAPTLISAKDVKDGVWRPVRPSDIQRMISYTEQLEKDGKLQLCIWDDHCLIGSPGHMIVPELMDVLNEWSIQRMRWVDYVTKGSYPFTEHYGAFAAEVPDPQQPSTGLRTDIIKVMEDADVLVWSGEAASHCLKTSMEQALGNFGEDSIKKSVLLEDTSSCIPGFEQGYNDFVDEYKAKGLTVSTTEDFLS